MFRRFYGSFVMGSGYRYRGGLTSIIVDVVGR